MNEPKPLTLGGRTIVDASDRVRRFAGLPWSGGPPEVWAFAYYDAVPREFDSMVTPTDVLCAAALHPGLSRSDLDFFVRQRQQLAAWLDRVPARGHRLWQANDDLLAHLDALVDFEAEVSLTLLSKVLHRKRPNIIPLLDRHVIDWYRKPGDPRRITDAWPLVIRRLRDDMQDLETAMALNEIGGHIKTFDQYHGISPLRVADIAIWMDER